MKHLDSDNMHSFCRTCLEELGELSSSNVRCTEKYNIHQTQNLIRWLYTCTSLTALQKDGLPKFLCQQCFDKLQRFYEFRNTCRRSERILTGLLSITRLKRSENTQESNSSAATVEDGNNKDWLEFDFQPDAKVITTIDDETKMFKRNAAVFSVENFIDEFEMGTDSLAVELPDKKLHYERNPIDEQEMGISATNIGLPESNLGLHLCLKTELPEAESTKINREPSLSGVESRCSIAESTLVSKELILSDDTRRSFALDYDKHDKLELTNGTHISTKAIRTKQKRPTTKKYEYKFRCDQCPRRCVSEENLNAHMRTHNGLRPFPCKDCERSFNKNCRLKEHIREVHSDQEKPQIVCSYEGCGKIFHRDSSYRMHYRLKHSGITPVCKTYICEDCGNTYKCLTKFREHRYKHMPQEEFPFQCEHCGKRYASKDKYKVHLLRHSGIKNYECPYCGMKKTTRDELRVHINYHTKEKQWSCPLCPSIFNNSANLRRHDRVVHKGIRLYACRFCDQSFGKLETLKHHEMRHTGEKPHVCEICRKRFIQPTALKTHMKTHKTLDKI